MRAIATALSLLLTLSISPLSSPLLGQPVLVRAFDEPSLHTFDAMGPDGVVASLGWRAGSSDATLTRNLQVGSAHSASPGAYNVPGSSPNDRAVGFLQGKGRAGVIDVRFRNATGSPIDAISIAFDAVQWKFSSDTRAQSGLELLFSSDGVTFVRLGDRFSYHAVPDLDFRPLISRNQSVRVMARISGRWILPSLLPPEAECVLRWRSTNSQIDGVGFAVDNVRFEAHPVLPTRDGDGFVTLHNPLLQDSQIFRPGISQPAVLQMRGRPGGSLTTLTVNIPEGWSIGTEASIEHDGPAFEGAELSVAENKLVIRNADLTDTKTGRLVLGECVPPVPATSGPRVFRVFTSTSERPGSEIQESPKVVLLTTVESLRRKEWIPSPEEEIAVEGTLICPYSVDNTQGEFFLEDHGSGLRVVFEEQRLSFGEYEKLLVRGRYVEDRARPTVLVTESFSLGTGRVATLRPSSIREIVAEPRRFEGSLVIVRNVRKARSTVAPWPPLLNRSTRYYLTDGDARDSLLLLIHPSSGLEEALEPRYPLTIRGIITRRNGDGVQAGTLTILPRTASDLDPVLTPPAPQARVPGQDEVNVSLMPSLEWDLVSDATTYHLQISTDSTFGSTVAEDSTLTGSSFRCPQLEPEEVYYWRVRALNADGAGPFSELHSFSTIAHPTVRIIDPASEEPLLTSSVALYVARTGFWYEGEQDAPTESFQPQSGFLKIRVGESVQGYVESDSLWIVRLVRGENVVTVELVDSEHRSLVPAVADSVRLTVSDDAWVMQADVGVPSSSFPALHNSSSITLRPELHQGDGRSDGPAESAIAVRVDGRLAGEVSSGTFSLSALAPGLHQIRVELVDREGAPHAPRVFDEFSIAIPDSAPYLRIASPVAGDTLDASQNSVTLVRRNLHTREAAITSGGGGIFQAFVLSVKGVPVDTSASDTLSVGRLPEGPALVRVEALTVQGVPFDPPVFDVVRVVARAPVESAKLLEELEAYVLEQNYPNPFNAETEIRFSLPVAGHATVRVFNLLGQEVALLLDSDVEAGPHTVRWNGLNDSGKKVSSGIYMFRLQSGPYVGTRRMLLVK